MIKLPRMGLAILEHLPVAACCTSDLYKLMLSKITSKLLNLLALSVASKSSSSLASRYSVPSAGLMGACDSSLSTFSSQQHLSMFPVCIALQVVASPNDWSLLANPCVRRQAHGAPQPRTIHASSMVCSSARSESHNDTRLCLGVEKSCRRRSVPSDLF